MRYLLLALTAMMVTGCMRIEVIPIKIGGCTEKDGLPAFFSNDNDDDGRVME